MGLPWITTTLFVAVAFYTLSVGPALLFSNNGMVSRETVHTIYAPLEYVHGAVPLLGQWLEWYRDLWV